VFYDDVAKAYGDELRSLYEAGCRYVQMDDTNLAYLCDEKMREAARQRGDDPNELPHRYAKFINKVVAQKPQGMLLAMHLCRGNFKSTHAAAGNYEPVAEALLKEMDIDAYFMEYDDTRSGDFKPLRYLPKGKTVVLGLVTTKFGQLEDKDELKRRIEEAAKYAPHGPAGAVAAMRLLQHRARQQHRGRGPAQQAAPGGGNGARGVGLDLTRGFC
jgi:5-methyltetrahydropteroyltriglutamate--homocysteine methyltransferase